MRDAADDVFGLQGEWQKAHSLCFSSEGGRDPFKCFLLDSNLVKPLEQGVVGHSVEGC